MGFLKNLDKKFTIYSHQLFVQVRLDELEETEEDMARDYLSFPKRDAPSSKRGSVKASDTTTRIYACATMWHETEDEMLEMLKSIFRCSLTCVNPSDITVTVTGWTLTTQRDGSPKSTLAWLTLTTTSGRVISYSTTLTKTRCLRRREPNVKYICVSQDTNEGKQKVVNDYVVLLCGLIDKAGSR